MKRNLGKDTLGGGEKISVSMRNYDRSTHNLSNAWRSTMGVGTLVPCFKKLALPGDTWDIDIDAKIFTVPSLGALYGNYKLQVDFFTCPWRLYIGKLHMNAMNIANKMTSVEIPQLQFKYDTRHNPTKENKYQSINQSSLIAYMGTRGLPFTNKDSIYECNALPVVCYYDIFWNYYANKQEDDFYVIKNSGGFNINEHMDYWTDDGCVTSGYNNQPSYIMIEMAEAKWQQNDWYVECKNGLRISADELKKSANPNYVTWLNGWGRIEWTTDYKGCCFGKTGNVIKGCYNYGTDKVELKKYKLEKLQEIREELQKITTGHKTYTAADGTNYDNPIQTLIQRTNNGMAASYPLAGLCVKTYQNDIFTNFINPATVQYIKSMTMVSTANNQFSIDALNLSQKKYNLMNRLATTNGTYKDWIEVGYTSNYGMRSFTPIYEGGMSDIIVFDEVVNTAKSEDNALGELGGRGTLAGAKKGGKLHIKIDEPSYIIGIVSITPIVDYCEGNQWDTNLVNLGQLHIPELDGIGYEDLKLNQLAFWADRESAYAKTTAWQNYMTSYNETYGDFCTSLRHMVLNREVTTGKYNNNQVQTSSYINPSQYNYTFADVTTESQNFQVQIGFGVSARRKMSARQIPTM